MLVAVVTAWGWLSGPVTCTVTLRGRSMSSRARKTAESASDFLAPRSPAMIRWVSPVVPDVVPRASVSPVSASVMTIPTGAA